VVFESPTEQAAALLQVHPKPLQGMARYSIRASDSNRFWWKHGEVVQMSMSPKHLPQANHSPDASLAILPDDIPLTVRAAAMYLGVSMQTVYLWVERKQIPHLRVMGRNIRFLKSDLEPFRATFKQEVGIGKTE
jgi:excisionase family DNA binding protein